MKKKSDEKKSDENKSEKKVWKKKVWKKSLENFQQILNTISNEILHFLC